MYKPEVFDKYLFVERVSAGGMAEVFKAITLGETGFKKVLAIKRVLPSIAADHDFTRMFVDEANIAGLLHHANIAQIYDLGQVGDYPFIAMEYVEGRDLRAIFDRVRKRKLTIAPEMSAYIISQVLAGLDYAHRKTDAAQKPLRLVHRDMSPPNILIGYTGEVKIVDFGIAKATRKAGKTQAGVLKGKFGYMSPEQVRGMSLDGRSDVFSTGIVLWEMLAGRRLFVGDTDFATLDKVRGMEIDKPSHYNSAVPPELDAVAMKALERDLDKRYPSAQHMQLDLQRYLYGRDTLYTERQLAAWMADAFAEEMEESTKRMREIEALDLTPFIQEVAHENTHIGQAPAPAPEPEIKLPPPGWSLAIGPALLVFAALFIGGVVLSQTPDRRVRLETPGPHATLTVLANVAGAAVHLGERVLCQTPCYLRDFPSGKHTLTVTREGYLADTLDLDLTADEEKTVTAALAHPGDVTGGVLLRSRPNGAAVQVDGKDMNQITPCMVKGLSAGITHTIALGKLGYAERQIDMKLDREEIRSEVFILKPDTPSLSIDSDPQGAKVFVDGKDTGLFTPTRLDKLHGDVTLSIKLAKDGYRPRELAATPNNDEEQELRVELESLAQPAAATETGTEPATQPGNLSVTTDPPAMVYIDGRPTNRRTPVSGLSLKPGAHELKLINPDANIHDISTVRIKSGETTHVKKVFPKE